ncbi:MAG: GGDEF domain-containing protein [Bacilli bacterium]|nr:GGDEF domain-containing protein [Bacilli bacterium]
MENKKINSIITGSIVAILLLFFSIFIILNYSKDEKSLSIRERKWITDNINNVIDVNIFNNIPLYGYNGSGISFSFLDDFSTKYNINFNKISYYDSNIVDYKGVSFRILNANNKLSKKDILLYQDEYVVWNNNPEINSIDSLDNLNPGILKEDEKVINNYLNDNKYIAFETINEITKALNSGQIKYAIVPNIKNTREMLENNFKIVYHISDLTKKYVLRVEDSTLHSIMKKQYKIYLNNNFLEDYSKEYLTTYFASTKTSDIDRKNYNGKIYKYGYVVNMPYEGYSNNNFIGTLSTYLSNFGKIVNTEIEVVRYNNIDELKNALVNGDVDVALTNFDSSIINMDNITTQTLDNEKYIVLSQKNHNINSIKGLKNNTVSVVGSSNLYTLCINNNIKVNVFKDTNDLIRNINDNDIILMDKDTYYYYSKVEKLSNFHVIYEDEIKDAYKFIVNEKNKVFAQLLSYYVNSSDYRNIRYNYNNNIIVKDDKNNTSFVLGLIVFIIVAVIIALYIHSKYTNSKYLKREERLKFIDPMTSLKNRNYLNHNIYKWDDNVVFPQAVIMLDVNKIKQINDQYGREIGDDILKKVASILIDNQLENTDIVRTGGDEFLIYMVGYGKEQVIDYIKKLNKEMKKINNSYGVEIGYSMILDQVKSVDDAINEAILMMEESKNKDK